MDGVTILKVNTYQVLSFGGFCFTACLISILYILALIVLYDMFTNGTSSDVVGSVISFVLITALICWGLYMMLESVNTTYTNYSITVDDTVTMSEFMDRYEIQKQDGKILVVREREIDDE